MKKQLSPVDKFYIWLEKDKIRVEEEAKLPRKKRGRKPTKKQYFNYINEQAIIAYNQESDQFKRNKIYKEHINYAFNKLVENIIHTFKFYYFDVPYEDVKCEVVAFLNEKIHKYNPDKGSKAYSYFSIVAKNYLIIQNNANYAKLKQKADLTVIDDQRDLEGEQVYSDYQESLRDFTNLWCDYYDRNLNNIFTNKRDIIVADSLLELFRIRENIENFNKKALYILIRERTGLKTQNITKVVNKMKADFIKAFKKYQTSGLLQMSKK